MSKQVGWTNQRIALLRRHIREWKANDDLETQARRVLSDRHQEERANVYFVTSPNELIQLIISYDAEIANLSRRNYIQQNAIRVRQAQQIAELEFQIKKAQGDLV